MKKQIPSFEIITGDIIGEDECARCGACIGLCPYLTIYNGAIVFPDKCDLPEGRCFGFCPKAPTDFDEISRKLWNTPYTGLPLGHYTEILAAKQITIRTPATPQYGGIVTALVQLSLSTSHYKAALVTQWKGQSFPEGLVIEKPQDALAASGSHYAGAYSLAAFNKYREKHAVPMTVVGLPCQALAIRKMECLDHPRNPHMGSDNLVIGLFCTWALSPRALSHELLERFGAEKPWRFDIPPPPANRFETFLEDGKREIPLDEIRPLINPACQTCLDMTAEFADISVGAVEGLPQWNTVIIRTEKGKSLFQRLTDSGMIEIRPLAETNLSHLSFAAAGKKQRALATGNDTAILSEQARETILQGGKAEEGRP
jgi:coenzyme F420 hydrogenase subunit beta